MATLVVEVQERMVEHAGGIDSLVVAVAQVAPSDNERQNLDAVAHLTVEARAAGAGLVVFPEYMSYFTPRIGLNFAAAAQPLDGSFVTGLKRVAKSEGLAIVAGMLEQADAGRFRNTLVAVDAAGTLVARYSKQHLYDAFGASESSFVAPGMLGEPQIFELGGVRIGMQTCFDVRFPEVTRTLVDAGAQLVLIPAQWVPGPRKLEHWRTLLAARAIENTVYIAAPGHPAPEGIGASAIIGPDGGMLAELGEDAQSVAVAGIDLDELARVRQINPSLLLRRYRVEPLSSNA